MKQACLRLGEIERDYEQRTLKKCRLIFRGTPSMMKPSKGRFHSFWSVNGGSSKLNPSPSLHTRPTREERSWQSRKTLRWLKAVSCIFQHLNFNGSILRLFLVDATIMASERFPITGNLLCHKNDGDVFIEHLLDAMIIAPIASKLMLLESAGNWIDWPILFAN